MEEFLRAFGFTIESTVFKTPTTAVFKASHPVYSTVALKLVKLPEASLERHKDTELSINHYLNFHPNFLRLLFCASVSITDQSYLLLITKWMGCDLRTEIETRNKSGNHWPESALLQFFKQLLGFLEVAQDYNISHRDIKPENLFMSENKKLVILGDFGSSRKHDSHEQTYLNSLVGTCAYMSPEVRHALQNGQGRSRYNPYKADVYSLGVTILTMADLKVYNSSQDCSNSEWICEKLEHLDDQQYPKLSQVLRQVLKDDYTERPCHTSLLRQLASTPPYTCLHLLTRSEDSVYFRLPCHENQCGKCCKASKMQDRWARVKCIICGVQSVAEILCISALQQISNTEYLCLTGDQS